MTAYKLSAETHPDGLVAYETQVYTERSGWHSVPERRVPELLAGSLPLRRRTITHSGWYDPREVGEP